jgi:RimJ/RimL family protein N-acetyltransferase
MTSGIMNVRCATQSDAERLFMWRNDPLTRASSRTTSAVGWDEHVAWLTKRLGRLRPDLYIAEVAGAAVGMVRIDGDEVSYTVAPEHRGKGYATQMLEWVRCQFGVMTAHVKPENHASIRAAERAGHRVVLL